MAWIKVAQRKTWGRPTGEVRVGVNDVRGTRLINIILGDAAIERAGFAIKDTLVFERGEGEDAGWVRVSRGTGETRLLGKLPNTHSGIVRFALPAELQLAVAASTACDEWEAGKGWVALRLPADVVEGRAAPVAKKGKGTPAPRPAIPLVEPKPQPPPKPAVPSKEKEEAALSLLRARVGTDQVVRETGISPRDVVRLAEQVRAEREGRAA